MLRVGLTGGIGSGKSTVSAQLAALGAVVVDADAVAREVVEPGTPGLAAVVDRFGPDGPHPRRRARPPRPRPRSSSATRRRCATSRRSPTRRSGPAPRSVVAAARPDAVVVHDMPLLVEKGMGAQYHLVVVVGAERGDARAPPRRPARDDRGGRPRPDRGPGRRRGPPAPPPTCGSTTRRPPTPCAPSVLRLWHERLEPFELNVRHGIRSRLAAPDPRRARPDVAGPGRPAPRAASGTPWATRR